MTELSDKFDAVSNSFVDVYRMLDGESSQQEILSHGLNEIGYLRASIMCMEESKMRDTEAASNALEELEKIELCGLLLKRNTQIAAETITLMLNNCEALRVFIQDCINKQNRRYYL